MTSNANQENNPDIHKGAVEDDNPNAHDNNTSMRGQQGHRNIPELAEGTDTDYPEPGQNPEHSGEKVEKVASEKKPSGSTDSEQKTNQNRGKDDLLAS